MPPHAPLVLDGDSAAFITGAVSINVAACRPRGFPALARGLGCRLSGGQAVVSVLLRESAAAEVLEAVRQTGRFAAVFSDPATHRTLQLKSDDALVLRPQAGDPAVAERYCLAFAAVLEPFGHTLAMVKALLACAPDDLVAVRFSPGSAFSQTPGPQAGEPLVAGQ